MKDILNKIDSYKNITNKHFLSLSKSQIDKIDEFERVNVTYHTNSIEGNTLSLIETQIILNENLSIGGKPLNYIYEVTGHAKAFDFMKTYAKSDKFEVTDDFIKKLHYLFYKQINEEKAGQYRVEFVGIYGRNEVKFPSPDKAKESMENFLEEFNVLKNKTHPVILAIFAHLGLVNIHPFVDGNGRTARLICNSILINEGYQLINITLEKKTHYMMSLYESYINKTINNPGNDSFYKFMAVCELQAQKDYCNFFNLDLLEESEITDYKID